MATSYKFVTFENLETFVGSLKNYLNVNKLSENGKFVKTVSAVNGQLSAEFAEIKAEDVKYDNGTLADTLGEIKSDLGSAAEDLKVTIEEKNSPNSGYLKTYVVKQNNELVGEIDIPKDFLVRSGSVVGTGSEAKIVLVLNTSDDSGTQSTVEIPVNSLVDEYTAGNGVNITGRAVSVKIDPSSDEFLTVSENGVKLSGVNTAISEAVSGLEEDIEERLGAVEGMLGISGEGDGKTVASQISEAVSTAIDALDSTKSDSSAHIKVTVAQVDGKIETVTVEETTELATKASVDALEAAAITVKAGEGISITGESAEKTISIDTDFFEEVSPDEIEGLFA